MARRDTVTKRGRGRPTALTPHRAQVIEAAIRRGNHITTACHLAGVSTATFYRWMERAERADYAIENGQAWDPRDQDFRDFRDVVLRARAEAAETMIDVVHRSAIGGQLISEEPALDGSGNPIRDDDGHVIMKRQWTQPDGRLALAYLKVAQPGEWAGGPQRVDVTSGGFPLPSGATPPDGTGPGGEITGDDVSRLASMLHKAIEARPTPPEDPDDDGRVYDAEIVEEP